jgi:hypothetical protein
MDRVQQGWIYAENFVKLFLEGHVIWDGLLVQLNLNCFIFVLKEIVLGYLAVTGAFKQLFIIFLLNLVILLALDGL